MSNFLDYTKLLQLVKNNIFLNERLNKQYQNLPKSLFSHISSDYLINWVDYAPEDMLFTFKKSK